MFDLHQGRNTYRSPILMWDAWQVEADIPLFTWERTNCDGPDNGVPASFRVGHPSLPWLIYAKGISHAHGNHLKQGTSCACNAEQSDLSRRLQAVDRH